MAIISIAATLATKAQTAKGNLFIGTTIGTTAFGSTTDNYTYVDGGFRNNLVHNYSLTAGPQVGVFLTDHLILGGTLNFAYNTSTTTGNTN